MYVQSELERAADKREKQGRGGNQLRIINVALAHRIIMPHSMETAAQTSCGCEECTGTGAIFKEEIWLRRYSSWRQDIES